MRDAPTINPPAIPSYIKHNLPGSIFDGNKQCQYSLGNPAARQCANVSNNQGSVVQGLNLATVSHLWPFCFVPVQERDMALFSYTCMMSLFPPNTCSKPSK
jgi:hypothetical protein